MGFIIVTGMSGAGKSTVVHILEDIGYYCIDNMPPTLITNFGGFGFILGQTFNTDREKYLKRHDTYELFNMTLTFSLFCIANIFICLFLTITIYRHFYYSDNYNQADRHNHHLQIHMLQLI